MTLLRGVAQSVLLRNTLGELCVLQANAAPPSRPSYGRAPLPSCVVWQHGDDDWLHALRHDNKYSMHTV